MVTGLMHMGGQPWTREDRVRRKLEDQTRYADVFVTMMNQSDLIRAEWSGAAAGSEPVYPPNYPPGTGPARFGIRLADREGFIPRAADPLSHPKAVYELSKWDGFMGTVAPVPEKVVRRDETPEEVQAGK